jgi:hypothetical protein
MKEKLITRETLSRYCSQKSGLGSGYEIVVWTTAKCEYCQHTSASLHGDKTSRFCLHCIIEILIDLIPGTSGFGIARPLPCA